MLTSMLKRVDVAANVFNSAMKNEFNLAPWYLVWPKMGWDGPLIYNRDLISAEMETKVNAAKKTSKRDG